MFRALYIGRFQPFHLGHLDCLKQILELKKYSEILIGIGSSNQELTKKNPFSFYERQEMLNEAVKLLRKEYSKIKFSIYPIPDFGNNQKWVDYILKNLPHFEAVFTGNINTEKCFFHIKKVIILKINKNIKATQIRKLLLEKNNLWQKMTTTETKNFLVNLKAEKRIVEILELTNNKKLDLNPSSNLILNTSNPKQGKKRDLLIIERWTDLEYLQKHNFEELDNKNTNKKLEKLHKEHIYSQKLLLETLKKYNVEYQIIKEEAIKLVDYEDFWIILSFGGDGTFLHAAKKTTDQLMIGVNSQLSKSVGYLTNFNQKNYEDLGKKIQIYLDDKKKINLQKKRLKIKSWPRIGVKINNQKVPFLAINEVFIGVPEIYKTSHFEIHLKQKKSYFVSNGVIVSTFQGSSAFYKSCNGKEFKKTNDFAYFSLLTYLIKGNLTNNQILQNSLNLSIIPQRLNHVLIFDGDKNRQINLTQGDVLKVFLDKKNYLKVLSK
jgi:nicotinamide-nucleotide adenylyltransferase